MITSPETQDEPTRLTVLEGTHARYRNAILAGERQEALRVVVEATTQAAYLDVLVEVVARAQAEVGELWAAGEISVAREHVATAVSQFVLAAAFEHVPAAQTSRGSAVVCGVEGDLHQLGPQIAADALEADGWDVVFLGTQLPSGDVIALLAENPPDLLGIGVSMAEHIETALELVREMGAQLGDRSPPMLLGGRGFEPQAERQTGPGTHVTSDIREAVAIARDLGGA